MRNLILKIFFKSKVIRAIVYSKDKRIQTFYAIPKGSKLQLPTGLHEVNEKDFYIYKGIPTYLYNSERVDPIDPFKSKKSVLTAEYYDSAISSKVAKDIYLATTEKSTSDMLPLFASLAVLAVVVVGGYFIIDEINSLQQAIRDIYEILTFEGVR